MGKMTDALRKARMLKERKEDPYAGGPAPIEEYAATPEPPAPIAVKPAVEAARPAPAPKPAERPIERPSEPAPVEGQDYSLVEEEAEPATEIPAVESLPIIEEPEEKPQPRRAPPVEPRPLARKPERPAPVIVEPIRREEKPLVFETVEEEKPAPVPAAPPAPVPTPVAAKAPAIEPPPPVEAKPAPRLEMPAQPRKEEPAPVIAWSPESAPVRSTEPEPSKAAPTSPAPAPVLPEVESTPKPAHLPYLSVHYGRDERLSEQFRRLKARLNEEGQARLILVASSRTGEGKTTVAMNLAAGFANTYGERVVFVDGNVTRPKAAEVLEIGDETPGLARAVRGLVSAEEAALKTAISGLWVVRADAPGRGGEGLLDSDGMRSLIAELRRRFTRVIVEIPALEDRGEGLTLAAQADVVLVPVMKSTSRRKAVRRLVDTLKDRGASRVRCVFIEA